MSAAAYVRARALLMAQREAKLLEQQFEQRLERRLEQPKTAQATEQSPHCNQLNRQAQCGANVFSSIGV